MAVSRETEIKLPVSNIRTTQRRLKSLGFRVTERRRFESNRLLDFADLRLRKGRCLLRLRAEEGRSLLTFKGAPLAGRPYKVRQEIETYVADGRRAAEILASLGLGEKFRYEKYRTTYSRRRDEAHTPRPLVELDETPVGVYLEVEGPPRWIDAVALEMGYARKDYITASYATLYFEHCRRAGRRPGNMVFSRGK